MPLAPQDHPEELDWLNKEHLKLLPENVREEKILEYLNKHGEAKNISKKAYKIIKQVHSEES